jgi:GNAT superfamily N-acetyltransferase
MAAHLATEQDIDGVTDTLTAAFSTDPLWSWAFPDPDKLAVWWRIHVASAMRYAWVWTEDEYAAAAVWIPPGGVELTEEEVGRIESTLRNLIGDRAPEVLKLLDRFEQTHPHDRPPHYYLTLLGTHPDHRGKGLGMALLAENLARIDSEGMPAYLESSNSANDHRYERLGFERLGSFRRPDEAITVSTMWREPGGKA